MRHLFNFKMRQKLITKCVMLFITKCDGIIIKRDFYYKMRRYNILYSYLTNHIPYEHEAIICNDPP